MFLRRCERSKNGKRHTYWALKKLKSPRGKQQLEMTWQRDAKFGDWAELADGCYLLRSNLTDIDAATLWQRYMQLTKTKNIAKC